MKRGTGWKRGTVTMDYSGSTVEEPGQIKGAYGVSRGPERRARWRLTHLQTGHAVHYTWGGQALCKWLGDALIEEVPALGECESLEDVQAMDIEDAKKIRDLLRAAEYGNIRR